MMQKETVGLIKSFIKMFSPLLDASVYENQDTVSKVRKLYRSVGNSTEEDPALEYEEQTRYTYEQGEDGQTTL